MGRLVEIDPSDWVVFCQIFWYNEAHFYIKMTEVVDTEKRNADFRALCAVTNLEDQELPTWLRKDILEPCGVKGGAQQITDEKIDNVFDLVAQKFPGANILAILTEATQDQGKGEASLDDEVSATTSMVRGVVGKNIAESPDGPPEGVTVH